MVNKHGYWKSPSLLGKLTINKWQCSIAMLVMTRGYHQPSWDLWSLGRNRSESSRPPPHPERLHRLFGPKHTHSHESPWASHASGTISRAPPGLHQARQTRPIPVSGTCQNPPIIPWCRLVYGNFPIRLLEFLIYWYWVVQSPIQATGLLNTAQMD